MAKSINDSFAPKTALATSAPVKAPTIPAEIRQLLGPAPITSRESHDAYERILSKMAEAVAPNDFVEWTWLKDIVDLGWEAARARRAKAVRLALARQMAIQNVLRADESPTVGLNLYGGGEIENFASQIYRSIFVDDDCETFEEILARLGLTEDAVNDVAYHVALDDMERLQRLIDNANARRDAVLREMDRRRESLARRLREAVASSDEILDAEFENVPGRG